MQKSIKFLGILLGGLVLLIIVAIIGLVTFINPNDFKPQVIQKVATLTGRQLTLNGDIRWSFFPSLGLQVNDVQLSNAKGFGTEPFAQVKHMEVRSELLPLLKGNIAIDTIVIDGLSLNLIKNAKGITNWQDLSTPETTKPVAQTTKVAVPAKSGYFHMAAFAIASLQVNDSHISWNNQQAHQRYDINQLKIRSNAFQVNQATPIDVQFVLQSTDPKMAADIKIDSELTLNLDKPASSLLQGKLTSSKFQFEKFVITDISSFFNAQNGVIQLGQITANLYQGAYSGKLALDTNGSASKIATSSLFKKIQAKPLMQALAGVTKVQVAGVADLKTHITMQGGLQTLNGNGQFVLSNGVLKGLDVRYWIRTAQALIHKETPTQANTQQTPFDSLSASFVIDHGIVRNNDLVLKAGDMQAMGHGTANLVSQRLDYELALQRAKDGELKDAPIPLKLSGPFSNVSVRLNIESLVKQQAKEQIKTKLGEQLQKSLGKELGDKLGKQLGDWLK